MVERKDFSLVAAAALIAHRLVKLSSGQAAYNTATATDTPIGVTKANVASGDDIGITPINTGGSIEMCAAGAITQGEIVYAAADGKIQAVPTAAGTYRKIGVALAAASGSGSIIEVLPTPDAGTTTVSA